MYRTLAVVAILFGVPLGVVADDGTSDHSSKSGASVRDVIVVPAEFFRHAAHLGAAQLFDLARIGAAMPWERATTAALQLAVEEKRAKCDGDECAVKPGEGKRGGPQASGPGACPHCNRRAEAGHRGPPHGGPGGAMHGRRPSNHHAGCPHAGPPHGGPQHGGRGFAGKPGMHRSGPPHFAGPPHAGMHHRSGPQGFGPPKFGPPSFGRSQHGGPSHKGPPSFAHRGHHGSAHPGMARMMHARHGGCEHCRKQRGEHGRPDHHGHHAQHGRSGRHGPSPRLDDDRREKFEKMLRERGEQFRRHMASMKEHGRPEMAETFSRRAEAMKEAMKHAAKGPTKDGPKPDADRRPDGEHRPGAEHRPSSEHRPGPQLPWFAQGGMPHPGMHAFGRMAPQGEGAKRPEPEGPRGNAERRPNPPEQRGPGAPAGAGDRRGPSGPPSGGEQRLAELERKVDSLTKAVETLAKSLREKSSK